MVAHALQVFTMKTSTMNDHFGSPEALGTSKFYEMIDKILIASMSATGMDTKRKIIFSTLLRFKWSKICIYWQLPGIFRWMKRLRQRMLFLSCQMNEILEITFFSLKGVIPFLLLNAFSCVLTGAFCQADLWRSLGRRRDNPRVYDAGSNDDAIKRQYSVKSIAGLRVSK